jgi:hypothetical protein
VELQVICAHIIATVIVVLPRVPCCPPSMLLCKLSGGLTVRVFQTKRKKGVVTHSASDVLDLERQHCSWCQCASAYKRFENAVASPYQKTLCHPCAMARKSGRPALPRSAQPLRGPRSGAASRSALRARHLHRCRLRLPCLFSKSSCALYLRRESGVTRRASALTVRHDSQATPRCAAQGESDSEEEHDAQLYDDGVQIAQMGVCEWEASTGARAPPPLQSGTVRERASTRDEPPHGGEAQANGAEVLSGERAALGDPGSDDEVDLRGCAQDTMCCPSTAGHRVTASTVPNLYRSEADARESRA